MAIQLNDMVMLVHPKFLVNIGRIGQVVMSMPIVNKQQVVDMWMMKFPTEIETTDGPSVYATAEGWRMIVIAPEAWVKDAEVDESLLIGESVVAY